MSRKIIVIGAGAAGIAATSRLLQSGFSNVSVLEAEHRIGGRIHTIPFASNVVDLGAQWCHGEQGNVVHEMAAPLALLDSATTKYDRFLYIFSNGEPLNQAVGDRMTELAIEIVECYKDDISKFRGSLGSFIVAKWVFGQVFEEVFWNMSFLDFKKNWKLMITRTSIHK